MAAAQPPRGAIERDVFVADEQTDVVLDVARYRALVQFVLAEEAVRPDLELSMLWVDESTMADLHERFMGIDGPTDVLAFPMDQELVESGRQPDQGGRGPGAPSEATDAPALLGDLVVCPAVARRQATREGNSVQEELELLVTHGVLHLLGYDHHEDGDRRRMRSREQELLAGFREKG